MPDGSQSGKAPIARISAVPNPVPVGSGYGTTTISWSTGDGQPGEVYVDIGDQPEQLFGEGPTGALSAPWIGVRSSYVFRLYPKGDRTRPLAVVVVMPQTTEAPVTHAPGPLLEATPNPVPRSFGFSTTAIRWTTGNNVPGQVYVSPNGGREELFAEGLGGTYQAPWIGQGSYTFTLYEGYDHKIVLAHLIVHREGDAPNRSRPR